MIEILVQLVPAAELPKMMRHGLGNTERWIALPVMTMLEQNESTNEGRN